MFDGSVEIMVHRRILTNDSITNSLAEPLNETAFGQGLVVRGKHLLIVDSSEKSAFLHRTNAQQFYMQPTPTFALTNLSYTNYSAGYRQTWSALADEMPRNLHLLTLDQLAPTQFLVRVEHFFELNEDATYSQPIEFDLQQLLHSLGEIADVTEMVLTANMPLSQLNRLNWTTTENESSHWNAMGEFFAWTCCAFLFCTIRNNFSEGYKSYSEPNADQNLSGYCTMIISSWQSLFHLFNLMPVSQEHISIIANKNSEMVLPF